MVARKKLLLEGWPQKKGGHMWPCAKSTVFLTSQDRRKLCHNGSRAFLGLRTPSVIGKASAQEPDHWSFHQINFNSCVEWQWKTSIDLVYQLTAIQGLWPHKPRSILGKDIKPPNSRGVFWKPYLQTKVKSMQIWEKVLFCPHFPAPPGLESPKSR